MHTHIQAPCGAPQSDGYDRIRFGMPVRNSYVEHSNTQTHNPAQPQLGTQWRNGGYGRRGQQYCALSPSKTRCFKLQKNTFTAMRDSLFTISGFTGTNYLRLSFTGTLRQRLSSTGNSLRQGLNHMNSLSQASGDALGRAN
eukprot:1161221-Pelagomonas_calceolata.AAC.8